MAQFIKINVSDNVAVAVNDFPAGAHVLIDGEEITAAADIPAGHKMALKDFSEGENVIKYGFPIGHLIKPVVKGGLVDHNVLKTNLEGTLEYTYSPSFAPISPAASEATFKGYRRSDGQVGIRNELWVIPTVGCVNGVAEAICRRFNEEAAKYPAIEKVKAFPHNYGCSQLGDDHQNTRRILADMVHHPNAAGVLVVALGCENNQLDAFREREDIPASELRIGLKCGGSDGFSGITANPLLGRFSDWIVRQGGTTVLTEVPEMFGAETLLMARCKDRSTFDRTVRMINGFKEYFIRNGQPVYENPSPGNKAGGISTLEEKSLGCTQKSGKSEVTGVMEYGERITEHGLNLLCAPGNDLVAATALAASGCQMVLFTTGRGTPFGTFVPTVKVSSNSKLAESKPGWIDFNAGVIVDGKAAAQTDDEFIDFVLETASGAPVCNEKAGYSEIAIFKTGVTL